MGKHFSFNRKTGSRSYNPVFFLSCEGTDTEVDYFSRIRELFPLVCIKCLKPKRKSPKTDPTMVLKRLKTELSQVELGKRDRAWVVIDRDQWTDDQLQELIAWTKQSTKFGVALTNPKFEYWLLLHYCDGKGCLTPQKCESRLAKYIHNYGKKIRKEDITIESVAQAISRAKGKRIASWQCCWRDPGTTTVHHLVEAIKCCNDDVLRAAK